MAIYCHQAVRCNIHKEAIFSSRKTGGRAGGRQGGGTGSLCRLGLRRPSAATNNRPNECSRLATGLKPNTTANNAVDAFYKLNANSSCRVAASPSR
ncbi:unnamed protein product [Leptosia nina]|uniref:Uncharacterized protein n=1 Tax=Leptosia nina TaxID=320188 RepID=A0AAV1ITZ8_9NEOP